MKVIFGVSSACRTNRDDVLVFRSCTGLKFSYTSDSLNLFRYGFEELIGSVQFEEEVLYVYENIKSSTRIRKIREGDCWIEDEEGEVRDFEDALLAILAANAGYRRDLDSISLIGSEIKHFAENGSSVLANYDVANKTITTTEYNFIVPKMLGEDTYAISRGKLAKYNSDLELQWLYDRENESSQNSTCQSPPIDNGSSIILHVKIRRSGLPQIWFSELVCINKSDASHKWRTEFPLHIDDMVSIGNDRVAAFSDGEICVVDCESGEVIKKIKTEIESRPGAVIGPECSFFIHGQYLFLINVVQRMLHIFNKESFECIREVELPDLCHNLVNRPYSIDNLAFYEFMLLGRNAAVLMIDVDNIQAPLVTDEIQIFDVLTPDMTDGKIQIIAKGISTDDLVRFGEDFVLNQMMSNGKSFFNSKPNKEFNGEVELVYESGFDDSDKAKELLEVMTKRIDYFVTEDGYRCGKGKKKTRMTYTIV